MDRHSWKGTEDFKLGDVAAEPGHFGTPFFSISIGPAQLPLPHRTFIKFDHICGHKEKKIFLI